MIGCCLIDRLYNNISFSSPILLPYLSKETGDGGLIPGKLVFKEEFEEFCKEELHDFLMKVAKNKGPDKTNIGGPGIVPIIHVSQMLFSSDAECLFFGSGGLDSDGKFILSALLKIGISIKYYKLFPEKNTPSTVVLSDPGYDNGNGERIFINNLGAALNYSPEMLDDHFFSSDVVVFGGTALVPGIHDNLTKLLVKAKMKGCITIVNTVYDFRNEKANPGGRWPLGQSDESYRNIDLLMTDFEEGLRLTGKNNIEEAIRFFRKKELKAVIITNGSEPLRGYSSEGILFEKTNYFELPVSEMISMELKNGPKGDTTGCGDNFAGGVIASIVSQIQSGKKLLDIIEACIWGIVSGGYSCFYIGGTFFEKFPGEKLKMIKPYYEHYKKQIGVEG